MAITSVSNIDNKHQRSGANQTLQIFSKSTCSIKIISNGIPNSVSSSDAIASADTIPVTSSDYTTAMSETISKSYPKTISDHSNLSRLQYQGSLLQSIWEVVSEHLSSQYIAQVDHSISRHVYSRIVVGCNVCNCRYVVDSVPDAQNRLQGIRVHMRDSQDTKHVPEMWDVSESQAAYSKGVEFCVHCRLQSRLLLSQSPVDQSSEGDNKYTCQFIVIWASSIVQTGITSMCAFNCSSENSSQCSSKLQLPVIPAVEVPSDALES